MLGESVMMPMRVKIDRPDPAPNSSDVSFVTLWKEKESLDLELVIDEWRRQGVANV